MKKSVHLLLILASLMFVYAATDVQDYIRLYFNGKANQVQIIAGDVDPSASSGVAAPIGSEYLRDNGDSFKKVGSDDTAWIRQLNTSTPQGLELDSDPSFEVAASDCILVNGTKSHVDTFLPSPSNRKATSIKIDEMTTMTCKKHYDTSAIKGERFVMSGWIKVIDPTGSVYCDVVLLGDGVETNTYIEVPRDGKPFRYELETPAYSSTTGYSVSCRHNDPFPDANEVIIDETSNKTEKISPMLANIGNVTEWQNFTPTGTWTTNAAYSGKWRRVGDSMEVQTDILLSGAPNASALTIDIPQGYTIDTVKLSSIKSDNKVLGTTTLLDEAVAIYSGGSVIYNSPTMVGIFAPRATATASNGSPVAATYPFAFGNLDRVSVLYTVPILGWSATSPTIVMQNETFNSDLHLGAWVAQPNTATCSSAVIEGEANVGKWTTCSQITASSIAITGCTTRPTQTDADAKSQGLLIYTRNYATARPCTTPVEIGVNIGKGFKNNDPATIFKDANKTSVEARRDLVILPDGFRGLLFREYNPHTGIAWYSGRVTDSSHTGAGISYYSGDADTGYIRINASKNPAMSGVNTPARQIVKTYRSGNTWYEVNNDCWVRQNSHGTNTVVPVNNVVTITITNQIQMSDGSYTVTPNILGVSGDVTCGSMTSHTERLTGTVKFTVRNSCSAAPPTVNPSALVEGYASKTAIQALGVDTSKCQ